MWLSNLLDRLGRLLRILRRFQVMPIRVRLLGIVLQLFRSCSSLLSKCRLGLIGKLIQLVFLGIYSCDSMVFSFISFVGVNGYFYKEVVTMIDMVEKVVGYVVSVLGIVVMAVGFGMIPFEVAFLDGVAGNYIAGAGIVLVVVGVVMSLERGNVGKKSVKGGEDEIPIYEGVGKKRKVVGYRKG